MYAFIQNGIVTHVLRVEPSTIYAPTVAAQYIPAPEGVEVGWLYDGVEFIAPAPAPTIEQRREARWEAVKSERKSRVNGGVLVAGHWYHTDVDSRVQHMRLDGKAAALLAAGGTGADVLQVAGQPIAWKTLANDLVPMTAALAVAIVEAIEVLDALAFARAETLRAQIEASEDPESIDITSGWPAVYDPGAGAPE